MLAGVAPRICQTPTVDDVRRSADKLRLEGYIAQSLRLRRRLSIALAPIAFAALVVTFIWRTPGLIALVIAVATIGMGLYITTVHVAEWRARLAQMADPSPRKVTRGGRR